MCVCRIKGEPQWAVCGESFPVGCRFHPSIVCSAFFSVNPDRRRRIYNTPTGIYREGCGLAAVHMSWSASEYLYMVRPHPLPPLLQPSGPGGQTAIPWHTCCLCGSLRQTSYEDNPLHDMQRRDA